MAQDVGFLATKVACIAKGGELDPALEAEVASGRSGIGHFSLSLRFLSKFHFKWSLVAVLILLGFRS